MSTDSTRDPQACAGAGKAAAEKAPPTEDAIFGGALKLLQPASGHRAGTDAVLLAAAVPAAARRIADLGAGSGVVGLRAAQTNPEAHVTLIEKAAELVDLAARNIALNRLEGRVEPRGADAFALGRADDLREAFDCVLTNPPFFEAGRVRVSDNENRVRSHVLEGSLERWLRASVTLLQPKGTLVMIHRADALVEILAACAPRLGALRLRFVHAEADAPAIRLLIAGTKGSRAPLAVLPPLVLNERKGGFKPDVEAVHRGDGRLDMQTGGKPRPL